MLVRRRTLMKAQLIKIPYSKTCKEKIEGFVKVIGRFEYDENNEDIPMIVIYGKSFAWDEFGRMLVRNYYIFIHCSSLSSNSK